jgi:hypothetical protein
MLREARDKQVVCHTAELSTQCQQFYRRTSTTWCTSQLLLPLLPLLLLFSPCLPPCSQKTVLNTGKRQKVLDALPLEAVRTISG